MAESSAVLPQAAGYGVVVSITLAHMMKLKK
jgi:hypothetical protein